MPNVSFTRDEVILALDVLYNSGEQRMNAGSNAIVELSDLLNRLPIHALSNRREIFRNPSGVSAQVQSFNRSKKSGIRDAHVGAMFYEVDTEFENRHDELHQIATAIKRNMDFYETQCFGGDCETDGFPEGALLGHLHRVIETRDCSKIPLNERCEICGINTNELYRGNYDLLTRHLLVPITVLDSRKRYNNASDYITVCQNCHAALHRYRPWLNREKCEDILY